MATSDSHPWRRRMNPHKKGGAPQLTGEQRVRLRERRDEGEDVQKLAVEYGVTASYVRHL